MLRGISSRRYALYRRGCVAALLCAVLASGCGFADAPGTPRTIAHRFGRGNWPENSRTGLHEALERHYPGIEFDLVLTKDRIPVISHDAALNRMLCTRTDGTRLPENQEIFIKDLTLEELHSQYVCGGLPNPDFPTDTVMADTHLTLDELLDTVRGSPDVILHFDVKYHPGRTLPADAFADEILSRIRGAELSNRWYMSTLFPEFSQEAAARGVKDISLTWPNLPVGLNTTVAGAGAEVTSQLGLNDPIAIIRNAGGNGLNLAYQATDRRIVELAKAQGMMVELWSINDSKALGAYCHWPVDILITDYEERSPCP